MAAKWSNHPVHPLLSVKITKDNKMHQIIGIDVGGSKMRLCVIQGERISYSIYRTGSAVKRQLLADLIKNFINSCPKQPFAIGIAVPGLAKNGTILACDVLPDIVGWSPAADIAASCPVAVLNDAEAALFEVAADVPLGITAAMVMVGTGIGAALMLNGERFGGACGWGGELGYIPMIDGAEIRTLDHIAGGAALLRALGGDVDAAFMRLNSGDLVARASVERAGTALGLGLATLINLINPSRLVLAGGTLRYPGYIDSAVRTARRFALPLLSESCEIQIPSDGETLVARGAARRAATAVPETYDSIDVR